MNKYGSVEDDEDLWTYVYVYERRGGQLSQVASTKISGFVTGAIRRPNSVFGQSEDTGDAQPVLEDLLGDGNLETALTVDLLGSDPSHHSIRILALREGKMVDLTPQLPEEVVAKHLADIDDDGTLELLCESASRRVRSGRRAKS